MGKKKAKTFPVILIPAKETIKIQALSNSWVFVGGGGWLVVFVFFLSGKYITFTSLKQYTVAVSNSGLFTDAVSPSRKKENITQHMDHMLPYKNGGLEFLNKALNMFQPLFPIVLLCM